MVASRIKGIMVEINGVTTGLSKALSGINKEILAPYESPSAKISQCQDNALIKVIFHCIIIK